MERCIPIRHRCAVCGPGLSVRMRGAGTWQLDQGYRFYTIVQHRVHACCFPRIGDGACAMCGGMASGSASSVWRV